MNDPVLISDKSRIVSILLLSFLAAFMIFFFAPLELFFNNPWGFVVGINLILPWFIVFTFTGFIMFSIFFFLLWKRKVVIGIVLLLLLALCVTFARFVLGRFGEIFIFLYILIFVAIVAWFVILKFLEEKAIDCTMLLFLGCLTASYFQMLFLNGRMVDLEWSDTDYSVLNFSNILNLLIWIIIAILPLVAYFIFIKAKKKFDLCKVVILTTSIILSIQVFDISRLALTTDLPPPVEYSGYIQVLDPIFELNNFDNIVVFLLDSLDTLILMDILEKYPELYDKLDGFTFYRNNIANYTNTFPAVTALLTGQPYEDNMHFMDYFEKAWANESLISLLKQNGYDTNLFLDAGTTFGNIELIKDKADNTRYGVEIDLRVTNLFLSQTRASLGRFAPYLLKDIFLSSLSGFGNTLYDLGHERYTPFLPYVNKSNSLDFYKFINRSNINTNNENKVFNFMFLIGAHVSSTLYYDTNDGSIHLTERHEPMSATRAAFAIIANYLDALEEAGVYDNTTIIILADHLCDTRDYRATVLLIKEKGARGTLQYNDVAELSNANFIPSVLEIAGIPHEQFGLSYFDIINGAQAPIRRYYHHTHWWGAFQDGTNSISLEYIYEVHGDANYRGNWVRVFDINEQGD